MNSVAAQIAARDAAPLDDFPLSDIGATGLLGSRRTVSVVMVAYMTGEPLEASVACVLGDPLVDELVVVDNGSAPAEAERLRGLAARDGRVVLVQGHGNVGFAKGANLGARTARGELLVFLNPDAFLQPGCIAALSRAVEGRRTPCVIGGRVLNVDRTEQRGARRGEITPLSALLSLSGLSRAFPGLNRFEVHWEREALPDRVAPAPTISGACFCMRREDFDAVDGFDEGYFLHVEDVDLCWRVRRMGGEVLFDPHAEVVHIGGTSQTSPLTVEFHKGCGLARYFRKRAVGLGQQLGAWLISPLVVAAAVARPLLRRGPG